MAIKIKETVKFEKLEDGKFQLDVRSYVCPHVQIYAEKALKKIGSGDEITIVFDNPSSGESIRSEEHTSELQSRPHLVCRLLLEKKKSIYFTSLSSRKS